jgi:hypothetical protein
VKCAACYADNAAWTAVCLNCGKPVVPIELCENGHILAPGERECAACPKQTWPEYPKWSGAPLLRGVLMIDGAMIDLPGGTGRRWMELRDGSEALGVTETAPGRLGLVDAAANDGNLRLLVRPDGLQYCRRMAATGKLAWQDFPAGQAVSIGSYSIRWLAFRTPARG